jgi:two-component system chemotaxis response regulator CheY
MINTASSNHGGTHAEKKYFRVLYADDVRELREIVRLSLSRDGHGVECAEDGAQALRRVQSDEGFDLVITDHHMPVMNGIELVRNLRALGFRGKIMVFSSELSPDVACDYRKLGVDRIIYKPVYPTMLREMLKEMFAPRAA